MAPQCEVCGCVEFNEEDGSKFCSECGAHQKNYMELEEDFDQNVNMSAMMSRKVDQKNEKTKTTKEKDDVDETAFNWTTFEALNIILKCWTDILVHNGASEEFKMTVLRIWAAYLQRRNIAFVDPKNENQPMPDDKFELFSSRDMVVLNKGKIRKNVSRKKSKKLTDVQKLERKMHKKRIAGKVKDQRDMSCAADLMNKTLTKYLTANGVDEDLIVELRKQLETTNFESENLDESHSSQEKLHETSIKKQTVAENLTRSSNCPETSIGSMDSPETSKGSINYPETSVGSMDCSETSIGSMDSPDTSLGSSNCPETSVGSLDCSQTSIGSINCPETSIGSFNYPETSVGSMDCTETSIGGINSPETSETSIISNESLESSTASIQSPEISLANIECPTTSPSSTVRPGTSTANPECTDTPKSAPGCLYFSSARKVLSPYTEDRRITKPMDFFMDLRGLMCILYLAIIIAEEDILLMDLIRWFREFHLPFFGVVNLLPPEMKMTPKDFVFFNSSLPSSLWVRLSTGRLAKYLKITNLGTPSYRCISEKLLAALKLPLTLLPWIDMILGNVHTWYVITISLPVSEIFVAAAILLFFKTLYVMDDIHEEILSDWAERINSVFKEQGIDTRLFSYREWHNYMNRVLSWVDQVGPASHLSGSKRTNEFQSHLQGSRFSHYFWTQGMWTNDRNSHCKNTERDKGLWNNRLLKKVMKLNQQDMADLTGKRKLFIPYKVPLTGMVTQYLERGHDIDPGKNRREMKRVAEKLNEIDFKNHDIEWTINLQKISDIFDSFQKRIKIVTVPLFSDEEADIILTGSHTFNELRDDGVVHMIVPDVTRSYWSATKKDAECSGLPKSYEWLLNVLTKVSECTKEDIVKRVNILEKMYVKNIREHTKQKQKP